MMQCGTIHMLEVCDFATSLGKFIVLGENKSKKDGKDQESIQSSTTLADTLSVTAKTLKLPETRKWLLQEELKMT